MTAMTTSRVLHAHELTVGLAVFVDGRWREIAHVGRHTPTRTVRTAFTDGHRCEFGYDDPVEVW